MFWRTRKEAFRRVLRTARAQADAGQATLEAAFAIPVLFVLVLMLVQPGIVLYDRMVMRHAAAEGCRLLATRSAQAGLSDERCMQLVLRQLSAVPEHDLFHVHEPACSWSVLLSGDESSERVSVRVENRLRLLPLFDAAGVLVGAADADGCISLAVEESSRGQPSWAAEGSAGLSPGAWVHAREGE